jgi:hypothetical protein
MKSNSSTQVTMFEKSWESARQRVFEILSKHPETREDDRVLIQYVMESYLKDGGFFMPLMNIKKFFKLYCEQDRWPSVATILRYRRKWQEKDVSLRGANYELRKGNQTKVIHFLAQDSVVPNENKWH